MPLLYPHLIRYIIEHWRVVGQFEREQPSWVTIDEGDRLGIVFASDDGGTEIVYLMRNLEDRVLDILDRPADVA
jgi:hypothetical protein